MYSIIYKSIKSLCIDILKGYLSTCVVEDVKNDKLEVVNEVMEPIGRLD